MQALNWGKHIIGVLFKSELTSEQQHKPETVTPSDRISECWTDDEVRKNRKLSNKSVICSSALNYTESLFLYSTLDRSVNLQWAKDKPRHQALLGQMSEMHSCNR